MNPRNIPVDGELIDCRFPHEAGHAVVAAVSSDDAVRIIDGVQRTTSGHLANAICEHDWKQGESESVFDLTVRRMAFAYGGALGEAFLLCEDEDFEWCALQIWNTDSGTEGDAAAAQCILHHAQENGLTAEEANKVSGIAWAKAMAAIRANRHSIIRIAKLMKDRHKVEDSEIREGLTIPENDEAA